MNRIQAVRRNRTQTYTYLVAVFWRFFGALGRGHGAAALCLQWRATAGLEVQAPPRLGARSLLPQHVITNVSMV